MTLLQIVAFLAILAGSTISVFLVATDDNRVRGVLTGLAVGIMAVSQQFLLMVAAGALQILLGLAKRRAKNPVTRKTWPVSVAFGVLIIVAAVYLFYLR